MSIPILRRLIASIAIVTTASSLASFGLAKTYSDVTGETRYNEAISDLTAEGILEGYANGSFQASAAINRAEFLKIVLYGAFDAETIERATAGNTDSPFPDVRYGDWYSTLVSFAKNKEIIQGYPDGLFHPERDINFVEAAKMLTLAYDQQIQGNGAVWYEPYARALESGKAIPPTVERLDAAITRGEMAEMMWRLREGRVDQPTKAYLNVKYPGLQVNLAADTPQRAVNCDDLRALREEAAIADASAGGTVMMRGMAEDAAAPASQEGAAKSYSQTNIQVGGVDEGDIVKTDGDALYLIRGQEVRIIRTSDPTDLEGSATIAFGTDGFTPTDLYLDGSRLIVLGQRWNQGIPRPVPMMEQKMMSPLIYPYVPPKAEVRIYDVTDRTKPSLERTVAFDGSLLSSRKIEGELYLIVNQPAFFGGPIPLSNVREEDILPAVEDSQLPAGSQPVARCSDVMILPRVPVQQYLTVGVIPLRIPGSPVRTEVILGSAEHVYASLENLYVATTEYHYGWNQPDPGAQREKTNLYRFAFTDEGVALKAQGSVPGRALNQFAMDEYADYFRIATTTGEQWVGGTSVPSRNALYILSQELTQVGAILDMAPGEQIYSTRFLGDRAYMVTFRQIDPLFVIDVSTPSNPRILGKLKIPGYSDYLHPYDEDHIIGFGKEAVESKDQNFAWYQGMKIALFDVSDVENPRELHRTVIGDRGTESPLLHNHKALLFERDRSLLSFPVSVAEIPEDQKSLPEGQAYGTPVFQGAHVYDISLTGGLRLRGALTDYPADAFQKSGDVMIGYGRDIERIVRIDDALFTIGQSGVASYELDSLEAQDSVTFPGYEEPQPVY